MNSDRRSADISGTVYEQAGKEIKEVKDFKTEHLGMGSFPLLAEKGKTYYAVCQDGKGKSKRFDLPAAVDHGYALSVNRTKDKIYVTVLKPADTKQNDSLYVLVHTRGIVHFTDRWDNEKNYIVLQSDQFPSGVLQLVLFDANLNPISERLVFINNNDQAQVSYRSDKENYTTRSLVKNKVNLTDGEGQSLTGSFSVAVTSDREVTPDSTSNILIGLLLTSDLRGNIENPAYYFTPQPPTPQPPKGGVSPLQGVGGLDLLMCTQGWRRYNMAEVAQGNFAKPKVPIETLPEISGIVKDDLLGTTAKNMEVTIMSLKDEYFDKTKTDKDGRFSFRGIEAPDSTSFTVRVKMKKTTTAKNLIIDKEKFPKRTLRALPLTSTDTTLFAQYSEKANRQYVIENGMRVVHLPEVTVSAKKKPLKKSPYYDTTTRTYTSDYLRYYPNLLFALNMPGLMVDFNSKIVETRFMGFGGNSPLFIVDGMMIESTEEFPAFEQLPPVSDIAQVDILNPIQAAAYGTKAFAGAIVIYTKTIEDYKDDDKYRKDIQNISPLGYQQPSEFYAPKYDTPEKRNAQTPDLRTTIHWQPVVKTNEQGEASFEFYTADEPMSYTVIIEGLANDGSIIRKEGKLWVKDK